MSDDGRRFIGISRFYWVAGFILAVSILVSVIGAVALPPTARIVRHSSGATYSKVAALWLFPISVFVAMAVTVLVTRSDRPLSGRIIALVAGTSLVVWQTVAFISA